MNQSTSQAAPRTIVPLKDRHHAKTVRKNANTKVTPKAKSVIWIFLCGGVSHVESFDPKPELNKYAGKTVDDTPYKDVLNPEKLKDVLAGNPAHGGRKVLMGLNTAFQKHGLQPLVVRRDLNQLVFAGHD